MFTCTKNVRFSRAKRVASELTPALLRSSVNDTRHDALKVRARLSTNDGQIALPWALSGYGLILRSQ